MSTATRNRASSSGTRSAIVGLGVTGVSVARYLAACGDELSLVDAAEEPARLREILAFAPEAQLQLGRKTPEFAGIDRVVASPGVPLDSCLLADAQRRKLPLTSDIELFLGAAKAPVIGITGTNAKSTVTTLVADMLERQGLRIAVGGNLGEGALELLASDVECYVLELSSFQLERLSSQAGAFACGCVLNLSDDHMDRYPDFAAYARAKHRVYLDAPVAVWNRDDALTRPAAASDTRVSFGADTPGEGDVGFQGAGDARVMVFGATRLPVSRIAMVGEHNLMNAAAATALALAAGAEAEAITASLAEFSGLPHRCQLVATLNGVRFVNDSKATNVGATIAALNGIGGERDVVLIAGGVGKGADFSVLREPLSRCVRSVVLIGEDGPAIATVASEAGVDDVLFSDTMSDAVALAARCARSGDLVLLAPACASFDMFAGFASRGDEFVSAVAALGNEAHA